MSLCVAVVDVNVVVYDGDAVIVDDGVGGVADVTGVDTVPVRVMCVANDALFVSRVCDDCDGLCL